jgi:hypothetical protein
MLDRALLWLVCFVQVDELLCSIVLNFASGTGNGSGRTLTEPSTKGCVSGRRDSHLPDSVSLPSGWPPGVKATQGRCSDKQDSQRRKSISFEAAPASPRSSPVRSVASEWLARATDDVETMADHDVVSASPAQSPRAAMFERV